MKTIISKTYLQKLIIYIHIENEIEERKRKSNPKSMTGADPAAPAPVAPRRHDNPERTAIKTMIVNPPEPVRLVLLPSIYISHNS